jgi:putative chitinase
MLTKEQILKIAPKANAQFIGPLVGYLNLHMPKYEVNTYLRVCHFLAQAAHEADSFQTLKEYASGKAYEGRDDLGNTQKGDGVKYKGRGIFQLTGRANYRAIGAKIGMDLEKNPELAESPEVAVLTALEYWKSRNLNPLADKDDVKAITYKVNGGYNGFEERKAYLAKAKRIIPKDFTFEEGVVQPQEELPPPPINPIFPPIVVAKIGDNSPYIVDLQNMLIKKGAVIVADGAFGPKTEQAVRDFQYKNKLSVTGAIDTDTLNRLMV